MTEMTLIEQIKQVADRAIAGGADPGGVRATVLRELGAIIGHGGQGSAGSPMCPYCEATGNGGHGGLCPNGTGTIDGQGGRTTLTYDSAGIVTSLDIGGGGGGAIIGGAP